MLKKIGQKILVAFASAQITAQENKTKKADKKEKKKQSKEEEAERFASVKCPYCKEHYQSKEIYRQSFTPENLQLKRRDYDNYVTMSFIECRKCKEMFGIKAYNIYSGPIRQSFFLKNI